MTSIAEFTQRAHPSNGVSTPLPTNSIREDRPTVTPGYNNRLFGLLKTAQNAVIIGQLADATAAATNALATFHFSNSSDQKEK